MIPTLKQACAGQTYLVIFNICMLTYSGSDVKRESPCTWAHERFRPSWSTYHVVFHSGGKDHPPKASDKRILPFYVDA
jgi:hypothetical protein